MTIIKQDDLIDSIADALQYISYFHPLDFIRAMDQAYQREENPAARDAIAQILINSRMCALGHRPICQDTGIVTVFLRVGMQVQWDADMSVTDMCNEGIRRAYQNPDNVLRASILADPDGKRANTKDNTPAVTHLQIVPGDTVEVEVNGQLVNRATNCSVTEGAIALQSEGTPIEYRNIRLKYLK